MLIKPTLGEVLNAKSVVGELNLLTQKCVTIGAVETGEWKCVTELLRMVWPGQVLQAGLSLSCL